MTPPEPPDYLTPPAGTASHGRVGRRIGVLGPA